MLLVNRISKILKKRQPTVERRSEGNDRGSLASFLCYSEPKFHAHDRNFSVGKARLLAYYRMPRSAGVALPQISLAR